MGPSMSSLKTQLPGKHQGLLMDLGGHWPHNGADVPQPAPSRTPRRDPSMPDLRADTAEHRTPAVHQQGG